jgi:hypothetical protein
MGCYCRKNKADTHQTFGKLLPVHPQNDHGHG